MEGKSVEDNGEGVLFCVLHIMFSRVCRLIMRQGKALQTEQL